MLSLLLYLTASVHELLETQNADNVAICVFLFEMSKNISVTSENYTKKNWIENILFDRNSKNSGYIVAGERGFTANHV